MARAERGPALRPVRDVPGLGEAKLFKAILMFVVLKTYSSDYLSYLNYMPSRLDRLHRLSMLCATSLLQAIAPPIH